MKEISGWRLGLVVMFILIAVGTLNRSEPELNGGQLLNPTTTEMIVIAVAMVLAFAVMFRADEFVKRVCDALDTRIANYQRHREMDKLYPGWRNGLSPEERAKL